MIKFKFLRPLSIAAFAIGTLLFIWSFISLTYYFQAKGNNRLPPAGSFIDGPDEFTFAIMADSGFQEEPVKKIIRDMQSQKAKFIFHLGDQARRLSYNHFEHLLQSMESALGNTPFYALPGNHDTISKDQNTEKYYSRAFGQSYYWFTYGNTLFIALNTSNSDFSKDQQLWLKNVLQHLRPSFKNCLLLMHVPPIDPRPDESYALSRDTDELAEIIKPHNITAIICGHIHAYIESNFKGIPLYIAPPSGQQMRSGTKSYGYLLCEVTKDSGVKIRRIDVTDKKGRNYFLAALSTEFNGIRALPLSFLFLGVAFILAFFSYRKK